MSPVDRVGPLTGSNFTLGPYEKFQPGFRDEKWPKLWGEMGQTQLRWRTQSYNFCAYYSFGNSYSCVTVPNEMIMMWKIQQEKKPVTGLKGKYEKIVLL